MKRLNKHKLGFSLLEMVLVLAIICLLGGVIGGICLAISNSFITTYNIDDSSDYALLFSRGFENSFLAKSQKSGASNSIPAASNTVTWYVNGSTSISSYPTLRCVEGSSDTAVFEPQFLGGSDGVYKWDILMFYKWDAASERVLYRILMKDNKNGTNFTYFYEGGFWVPRFTDRKVNNSSNSMNIICSGDQMTSGYLSTRGFSTAQFTGNQLNDGFYSKIEFHS
ncbi:MAG: type II secretion system protein [Clostridiales bacterium]|nr:type II secretion system protein [Clostridiales bacterium]